MPFTFSHPAIVIPFFRYGSITALVIGSIVPDFEGLIIFNSPKEFSHSWKGVFLLNIPLGLCLCYLFQLVVRKPLLHNLPAFLRKRFHADISYNWVTYAHKNPFKVLISLLAGIVSHLLWDYGTHPNDFFWQNRTVVEMFGKEMEWYILVQYLSSLLGVILVLHFVLSLPKQTDKVQSPKFIFWFLVAFITLMIPFFALYKKEPSIEDEGILINAILSGFLCGILTASVIHTLTYRKAQQKTNMNDFKTRNYHGEAEPKI